MSTIAIITARGGSKRIPRKNIKNFCGKPILAYSIVAAQEAGIFDEIMVSTDDEKIAEIAREYGASVPFLRGEKTSGDFATTNDVIQEVLDSYKNGGTTFESVCCIYPTAPFITSQKLKDAMELLSTSGAGCVMPVVKFSFPPQRGMVIRDGKLEYVYPENRLVRSQDLEAIYHDCGQFYCFTAENFERTGQVVAGEVCPIPVDEREVQDIDEPSDWEIAEMKYRIMTERKNQK